MGRQFIRYLCERGAELIVDKSTHRLVVIKRGVDEDYQFFDEAGIEVGGIYGLAVLSPDIKVNRPMRLGQCPLGTLPSGKRQLVLLPVTSIDRDFQPGGELARRLGL